MPRENPAIALCAATQTCALGEQNVAQTLRLSSPVDVSAKIGDGGIREAG